MSSVGVDTTERWQAIKAVLDPALDLDPPDRAAFLDGACGEDAALRREVEAFLAAEADAPAFLDGDAADFCLPLLPEVPEPAHPERIGPYRLVREIGRGGMGAVFLAERADGQFEQRVALKLLHPGLDGAGSLARRFLAERQILASLNHPNVARLLDGGVTEGGQPYFVMEYVDGEPITAYCDARRLPVPARLALFEQVVEAVAYAHRNLVVHRDLKPSNILVTEDGAGGAPQVKLLDFGIARLLDPAPEGSLDAPGAAVTREGLHVMTPAWASPEQVRGEPVTTVSDVYQLGLLLYTLLVGRHAYTVDTRSPSWVERVVCEEEPARPSAAVAGQAEAGRLRAIRPDRLRRRLAGDLDTIVLKALRKEPERRYASASALVEDVRRHRAGRAVLARPDTLGYRTRTFVRRHRWGVTAAVLVAASLLGGLGAALWQADRAERAAAQARHEAATAEEVTAFLSGLFTANTAEVARGDTLTVAQVLARGVERMDTELAGRPAVRARLLAVLGDVYTKLGRFARADTLLREALGIRRRALDPVHPEVAESHFLLGALRLAQDSLGTAERELRTALRLQRRLDDTAAVARTLNGLGFTLIEQGDYEASEAILQEALALQRALYAGPHLDLATTFDHLGTLYYHLRDFGRAEAFFREALAMQRQLHGNRPHPALAVSIDNMGAMLWAQKRYEEAEAFFREALAMQRALHAEPHPDLAISLNNLAVLMQRTGRYEEAERLFLESLALKRSLYGPRSSDIGVTLGWLGELAQRRGALDESERLYRRALAIAEAAYPPGHTDRGGLVRGLAALLARQGRWAEAERLYREGYEAALAAYGSEHTVTQRALAPLPGFYEARGKPAEAARYQALVR